MADLIKFTPKISQASVKFETRTHKVLVGKVGRRNQYRTMPHDVTFQLADGRRGFGLSDEEQINFSKKVEAEDSDISSAYHAAISQLQRAKHAAGKRIMDAAKRMWEAEEDMKRAISQARDLTLDVEKLEAMNMDMLRVRWRREDEG